MLRILGVGALIAGIALAWLLLGKSEAPSSDQASGESTLAEAREKNSAAKPNTKVNPAGDTLPTPVRMTSKNPDEGASPVASGDSLAAAFESEDVDKDLSAKRSAMIRNVLEDLVIDEESAARLSDLECRSIHCRLKIAGEDQKSVTALVDALQDERGFYGKAESLMMSRDGDEIHMYLRFAE
jgi:hypothetical protein